MPEAIHIVIADDHPIFRSGLRQVLAAQDIVHIIDEVSDGESALRSIETLNPDVALLDIDMPKKNGLDVIKALHEENLDIPVIFLTMYNDREMFNRAMDLGARGYVLKESAAREIVESIKLVAEGKYYVSPAMSAHLIERNARAVEIRKTLPGLDALTPTERRILRLIADGKTSKEIGSVLHVSVRTVDNHRLNISSKLDIHGTHQLLKFAVQNKSSL
ncbi:MAG: response regulator transcription factor [Ignavibacteriales bacterium]|nr:response regulator transcription factor [Ignavibacteriales bacterium]